MWKSRHEEIRDAIDATKKGISLTDQNEKAPLVSESEDSSRVDEEDQFVASTPTEN